MADEEPTVDEEGSTGEEAEPTATRYGVVVETSAGQTVLHSRPDELLEVVAALREDGFAFCVDVCAVDYLEQASRRLPPTVDAERFEVVYGFMNHERRERIRVRVQVPADGPAVPSIFDHYPGAEAMEREAYDLMGVEFTDHPDPTRILMPETWVGHPLRKDHEAGRIPVEFKGAPSTR